MPRSNHIDLLVLVAILLPDLATATVSLNQFQAIVGFPQACTNAYQTPVTSCTASDFSNGAPCSANCISGLQQITTSINTACQGSKANPDSLIGLFFQNKGVDSLCPNSGNGAGTTSRGSTTLTQVTIGGSATSTSRTTAQITTSSTSSSIRTTSSSSTEASSTQTSASQASSTAASSATSTETSSKSTAAAQSTLQITGGGSTSTTSVSRNTAGFTTTVFNQGEASVITSRPEQTGSNNPEAFGGGGSPFEVGPNSSGVSRVSDLLSVRFAATLAAAFLLAVGLS